MTRAVSKTAELSGKYLISSDYCHILNLERFSQLFRKLESFFVAFATIVSSPDGPHTEGLPECRDKDLLQVRRNRTHSQGMSKQGLKGENRYRIFCFHIMLLLHQVWKWSVCLSRFIVSGRLLWWNLVAENLVGDTICSEFKLARSPQRQNLFKIHACRIALMSAYTSSKGRSAFTWIPK